MRPIVDGIKEQYGEQADFIYLNATDGAEGQAAFEQYGLQGHPAVLWINPDGSVGWKRIGSTSAEVLKQAVEDSLAH